MGKTLESRLREEILVMSGAMGTLMARMGAELGGCIGQWIVEHPEPYQDLAREYFRVGCHIVSGGTFNLNRISLAKFGLAEKAEELNRGIVRILKEVQPEGKYVAGSMGPTGRMLKPLGDLDPGEAFRAYAEQARALAADVTIPWARRWAIRRSARPLRCSVTARAGAMARRAGTGGTRPNAVTLWHWEGGRRIASRSSGEGKQRTAPDAVPVQPLAS